MAEKRSTRTHRAGDPAASKSVAIDAGNRLEEAQRRRQQRRIVDGHPLDPDRLFVGYTILDEGPMYATDAKLSKRLLAMPPQERHEWVERVRAEMDEADEKQRDGIRYALLWFAQAEAWLALECIRKAARHG